MLMRALPSDDCLSWGRVHRFRHYVVKPTGREALTGILEANRDRPLLGYGLGRSYGDSCLNQDGVLIQMSGLNRILSFDSETGDLTCEAGVTIALILTRFAKPSSDGSAWFPPVSPGTRFVTVGGAIANDVHGKNHHSFGTIGRHVRSLELLRSDGSIHVCSRERNTALFTTTIGGLGLTGLILSATIRLRRGRALRSRSSNLVRRHQGFLRAGVPIANYLGVYGCVDRLCDSWPAGLTFYTPITQPGPTSPPVAFDGAQFLFRSLRPSRSSTRSAAW